MRKNLLFTLVLIIGALLANADPCTNIITIQCGDTIVFNSNGPGDPNYPNGMNGQGCSALTTGQGGQETIYMFIVPPGTGLSTYQIIAFNGQGGGNRVDYYYKDTNICNPNGWSCIGYTSAPNPNKVSLNAYNWQAGDTILILVNAELTTNTHQSFTVKCGTQVCSSIQNINCGDTAVINVFGHGDPSYPVGMHGQGCSGGTKQGGREIIYSFVVPAKGTYQLNAFNGMGGGQRVAYYYKDTAVCDTLGWTCLSGTAAPSPLRFSVGAFNADIGQTILILANVEDTNTTTQSFTINCFAPVCSTIQNYTCGDTVTINVFGHGDPSYPQGMNGQTCGVGTNQGGREIIYSFAVPTDGTYQLNAFNGQGGGQRVDYYYKDTVDCDTLGWSCIGSTSAPFRTSVGAFNAYYGDTILILANVEDTNTTTQSFTINCFAPVCSTIQNINCGDTISINVFGHGDPDYPVGMNGSGCPGVPIKQGGRELIYRFIPPSPTTCTYQINAFSGTGGNHWVDYYYKDSSTVCDTSGWICLDHVSVPGTQVASLGAFNWSSNDTILILANIEWEDTTTQKFQIVSTCCPVSGIEGSYTINKIKISPNPSSGIFKIELPQQLNANASFSITDIMGNKVQVYKLPQQKYFEVILNLANGIYILNITSPDLNYRAKLILHK